MKDTANFAQDYFKNMSDFYNNFDFKSMMPDTGSSVKSGQQNMQTFFELVNLMNEKSQMILKKQMEIFQDNIEEVFSAVKDLGDCPLESKDILNKQNEFSHKSTTRNMQHATELGALYTQAATEMFKKYSDQVQHNVNDMKKSSKGSESKDSKKK